tara:strand:- start:108 stop:236 length:129 start_codon:yes stop_codon:yes gene_type:complete
MKVPVVDVKVSEEDKIYLKLAFEALILLPKKSTSIIRYSQLI